VIDPSKGIKRTVWRVKSYSTERVTLDRYDGDVCQVTRPAVKAGKGRDHMLIETKELFETKAEAMAEFRRRCGRPQPTSKKSKKRMTPLDRALRQIDRLGFALEDALPGLRDLVAQNCPDPAVREHNLSMLRRVEAALRLLPFAVPNRAGRDVRYRGRRVLMSDPILAHLTIPTGYRAEEAPCGSSEPGGRLPTPR
jgi:hypothetical protein